MNLKKYIPIGFKQELIYLKSSSQKYIKDFNKDDKKIIIALPANYGNLGDIAISYAQRIFLEKNFPNYKILEVPIDKSYENMKSLKRVVGKQDIILLKGGGDIGNLYPDIEVIRQKYIKKFPNNKIISFPQTIYFSNDKFGNKMLKKVKKVYGKHKNLVLFARENKSYIKMKEVFNQNKVYLVPDIVLSLNEEEPKEKREYITLCFRKDIECKMPQDMKEKMIKQLKDEYNEKIIEQDTHIGDVRIEENEREDFLQKIWTTFRKSKIVLTDRLHGMIFCAITGTPCIAFPNSNGKIQATYETWLKDLPNIEMVNENTSIEEIKEIIQNKIRKKDEINYTKKSKEYDKLIKEIERI